MLFWGQLFKFYFWVNYSCIQHGKTGSMKVSIVENINMKFKHQNSKIFSLVLRLVASIKQRTCNPTLTSCTQRNCNESANYFSKLWIISSIWFFFFNITWFWNWIWSQLSWVLQSGERINGTPYCFSLFPDGSVFQQLNCSYFTSPSHLIFILVLNCSCHWHHMCQPMRNNVSIICCKMILTPGGFMARWTKAKEKVIYFLKTRMPIY